MSPIIRTAAAKGYKMFRKAEVKGFRDGLKRFERVRKGAAKGLKRFEKV